MDVDNKNLENNFENIKLLIDSCDFISIDTELTGLSKKFVNYYDTPEMRYQEVKEHSMQYTITQIGICIFKFDNLNQKFKYNPINFHVKPFSYHSENGNFLTNSDTIEFLNKTNFDFNKTFREGIQYVRFDEYHKKEKLLGKKKNLQLKNLDRSTEIFDFENIQPIIKKSIEFLENDELDNFSIEAPTNSYERYLIFSELWKKVGCVNGKWIYPESMEYGKKTIIFKKCDNTHAKLTSNIDEEFTKKHEKNSKYVKITEIIKHISDSKKAIIAHNCFLDIMHIVDKFIEPLPENYEKFKTMLHRLFPKIFDTKYIFHEESFKDFRARDLEEIFNVTKQEPFLNPNLITEPFSEEFSFPESDSYHTAHYDAMVTGKCFIGLITYLNQNNMDIWENFSSEVPNIIHKYLNRIKVVRAEFNSMNVNPNSNEKKNSHKQIFHMAIPEEWGREDIVFFLATLLNKPLQDIYEKIGLNWLNSTSLMIRIPIPIDSTLTEGYENDDISVRITPFDIYYKIPDRNEARIDSEGFEMVKRRKRS